MASAARTRAILTWRADALPDWHLALTAIAPEIAIEVSCGFFLPHVPCNAMLAWATVGVEIIAP